MKIIVDAFGGDYAPLEIIKGSIAAQKLYNIDIIFVGNENIIKKIAGKNNIGLKNAKIIHADDVITFNDNPTEIIKKKKNSSMALGLEALAKNEGDGFISAGSSGALLVGSTLIVKRIKGIRRCALAPVIPNKGGIFMLIDGGASVECRPEMLYRFGQMGSIYMEKVMKIANPRVGLVNVGTEKQKGDELRQNAFQIFKNSNLNFIGNIEASEIPNNGADVVVTDGFTGNVILKMYEGMAHMINNKFKEILTKNFKTKFVSSLIMPDLIKMKKSMDYNEYGGAPLMGIAKPVFKAHGTSCEKTFKSAIKLFFEYIKNDVIALISENIDVN